MRASQSKKPVGAGIPIAAYSESQPAARRETCEALRRLIVAALPRATARIWHGSPVWFIDENPVVCYSASSRGIALLFWNGQAFDEPALQPMGKARAAQVVYAGPDEVDAPSIRRWLKKAKADVFDSTAHYRRLRETQRRSARRARRARS